MHSFFSFQVAKNGEIYAILGQDREQVIARGKNPDNHSFIADYFGISEHESWKFDLSLDYHSFQELMSCISHKKKLGCIKQLIEESYTGGLAYEDLPLAFLQKIVDWLIQNRELIELAGRHKLGQELIRKAILSIEPEKESYYKLIQLSKPITEQELIGILGLEETWHPDLWKAYSQESLSIQPMIIHWRRTGNNSIFWISVSGHKEPKQGQDENSKSYEWRLNLHTCPENLDKTC